jgi:hypothetical protein
MGLSRQVISDYLSWAEQIESIGAGQKNGLLCNDCATPLLFFRMLGRPYQCEICHEITLNKNSDLEVGLQ